VTNSRLGGRLFPSTGSTQTATPPLRQVGLFLGPKSVGEVLKEADEALYRAKQRGGQLRRARSLTAGLATMVTCFVVGLEVTFATIKVPGRVRGLSELEGAPQDPARFRISEARSENRLER
jgi:hypothetical protein